MARSGKAVVLLLGMLAVLGIVVAGGAVVLQMQEKELRLSKERELMLSKAENEDLQQQLRVIRETKQQLEGEVSRIKEQLSSAIQQAMEERAAKETMALSVEEREREINRLVKDLEQARLESKTVSTQIAQLKKEQEDLFKQISDLEEVKTQLQAKVLEGSARPSVQLDKVVVTSPSAPASFGDELPTLDTNMPSPAPSPVSLLDSPAPETASAVEGQVVVVNREYDFIVVNLGRNQGVVMGQELNILRDQKILGRVKIEKIYDELSAAAILPDSNKDSIREGDSVKPI